MDLLIVGGVAMLGYYQNKNKQKDTFSPGYGVDPSVYRGLAPQPSRSRIHKGNPIHFDSYARGDSYPGVHVNNEGLYDCVTMDEQYRSDALNYNSRPAVDPPRAATGNVVRGNVKELRRGISGSGKVLPFFRSSKAQAYSENMSDRKLDTFTGQEPSSAGWGLKASAPDDVASPPAMFEPTPNVVPKTVSRFDDRIVMSQIRNNVPPVDPINVGRGINLSLDTPASGGFQQFYRVTPDNVDAYRKHSNRGRIIPGKNPIDFGTSGYLEGVDKNGPAKFYEQERLPTQASRGAFTAARPRLDLEPVLKATARDTAIDDVPGPAVSANKAPKHRPYCEAYNRADRAYNPEPQAVYESTKGFNSASSASQTAPGSYAVQPDSIIRWTQNRDTEDLEHGFGSMQPAGKGAYAKTSEISRPITARQVYSDTSSDVNRASRASGVSEGPIASKATANPTNRSVTFADELLMRGPATTSVKAPFPNALPEMKATARASTEYAGNPNRQIGASIFPKTQAKPPRYSTGDEVLGRAPGPQSVGGLRFLEVTDAVRVPLGESHRNTLEREQTLKSHPPASDVFGSSRVPESVGEVTKDSVLGPQTDTRTDDLDLARRQLFGNPLAQNISGS